MDYRHFFFANGQLEKKKKKKEFRNGSTSVTLFDYSRGD